ncbi:PASTA domain-containing protein [Algoriphagus namhaensis]
MSSFGYSLKKVLVNLLIILGLSALLGYLFLKLYLPMYTNHGENVSVPDLSGYTFDEVQTKLSEAGLQYEVSPDSGYSTDLKPLAVLKHIPGPNALVKNGRKIYLTLNARNAPLLKMPNLVNTPLKNVQEILANMGLERGDIIYVPDIGINVVLEQKYRGQSIPEGAEIPKGARIDLVVGDGLGNQILSVPNMVGLDETEAEFVILGSGLRVGEKRYTSNDTLPAGRVFLQSPQGGSQVKTGEIIDLWIVKE